MITSPEELKMMNESMIQKPLEEKEQKLSIRERISVKWANLLGGKKEEQKVKGNPKRTPE